MVTVAWSALGILAGTLIGSFHCLGTRIDALGARLDARIDQQSARIDLLTEALQSHIHRRAH